MVTRSRTRLRRVRQRGATLFVVVLVMTLIMGIGSFAARSAHLATAHSGYMRHQTQARYLGEYGLQLATSMMSGSGGQGYLKQLGNSPDAAADTCTGQGAMKMRSCLKLTATDIAPMVTGISLCEPKSTTGVYPGSLGLGDVECFFGLELTDKMQGMTPAGFDTAGGKPLKFFYATATLTAQVRLVNSSGTATTLDVNSAETSGTQTLRARILAGPYPAN